MSGKPADDPPGPFMTEIACLKVHMKLEKRLTKLEYLNGSTLLATIVTLVTLAYFLLKLGGK
jgi:hypothetical protein